MLRLIPFPLKNLIVKSHKNESKVSNVPFRSHSMIFCRFFMGLTLVIDHPVRIMKPSYQ